MGLAGGSFATGIAYTSAWFSKERQGNGDGIFGAGNAGSAITNLVAPLLVVALAGGWCHGSIPSPWIMAVMFWFVHLSRSPKTEERKKSGVKLTLGQQVAPTHGPAGVAIRSGIYYFVFGGFVAWRCGCPNITSENTVSISDCFPSLPCCSPVRSHPRLGRLDFRPLRWQPDHLIGCSGFVDQLVLPLLSRPP